MSVHCVHKVCGDRVLTAFFRSAEAAGGCVPRLIVGGVSEGHLDGGRWEGSVALWFYKVALKEDEMNIVCAQLTHAAWVLIRMAGTVEVPDCSGLAYTCSRLTPCLSPGPHSSLCPHPTARGYARCLSLPETCTSRTQTEWVGGQVNPWVNGCVSR